MDARAIEVDETSPSPSPSHGSVRSGTFDAIPSDVLAFILLRLDPPSLRALELCCRRFKDLIKERNVWKQLCFLRYESLRYHAVRFVDEGAGAACCGGSECRAYRRLVARIELALEASESIVHENPDVEDAETEVALRVPPTSRSLIAEAIEATSTDHPDFEGISNVLSPEARLRGNNFFGGLCYWSSRGSESPMSSEAAVFRLSAPMAVIHAIQIRPFEAHFQTGSPIYSSIFVRFSVGAGACVTNNLEALSKASDYRRASQNGRPPHELEVFLGSDYFNPKRQQGDVGSGERPPEQGAATSSGSGRPLDPAALPEHSDYGWHWRSDVMPMHMINALQSFTFEPRLLCGPYLRVEFLGKTQKQEIDSLFYTCIANVRVIGTPVDLGADEGAGVTRVELEPVYSAKRTQ